LKDGGSFSQVIKRYLPAPGATAQDLLATLDAAEVSDGTIERIGSVIASRGDHPVREPGW